MSHIEFIGAMALIAFPIGMAMAIVARGKLKDRNDDPGLGPAFFAGIIMSLGIICVALGIRLLI